MRHVPYDPKKITYPDGWSQRAADALAAVASAPDAKKSEVINSYQKVWADLKPELKKVMHDKCWYTEAPQSGTDTDVDHFRPKNSVKGVKKTGTDEEHLGYWWRAFDPTNYRYSCIVANRLRRDLETGIVGGKADEFPLWDENERAWCPTDDCDAEQPLLIDPCDPAEVAQITFAENGEATERHGKDKPKFYEKAHRSILLYHLNHSDFVKARIIIRDDIIKHIEDAKRYYRKLGTDHADADDDHAYMRAIEQLRQACSEEAPFSSFAIALLRPYRLDESLEGVFIAG
jgi:hypothetical protein